MKKPLNKPSKAEALLRLQNLCSHAEKSEFEIRKKLIQWELSDESDEIIESLRKDDFLDPLRFSRAFIHDKITFFKWGKNKVRYQLLGHQIPENIIQQVLSEINEAAYQQMIFNELKKKRVSLKEKNPYKLKAKLFAFGNQRGYESSIINQFFITES